MIRSNAPDSLIAKAKLAFEVACRKVIDRVRQSGTEIVIWRDGQIVELSPEESAQTSTWIQPTFVILLEPFSG
jgi:hypothetical protein